jgi:hypothetical protein
MREEQLTIICKFGSLSVEAAIVRMQTMLARHDVPFTGFALYGEPVDLPSALSQLEKSQRKTFNLTGQGFEFHYSSVLRNGLDHLTIKSSVPSTISWDEWVTQFTGNLNFVMAWVVDSEYDHWQNAKDPLQYTAVGKPYAHLPMKSNGLPYPVEQKIIDTSTNPGRWLFRDGFIEAVGSVMWLGAPLWSLTGADQKQVMNATWLRVSNPAPAVVRLQAAERCFTTADDGSGELQSKLRSLLFPPQDASSVATS